jgi:hypothetical protein
MSFMEPEAALPCSQMHITHRILSQICCRCDGIMMADTMKMNQITTEKVL